jgi:hypothetical protein
MLDRLGKVLYWLCCFAAVQFAVASVLVALWSEQRISAVGFALLGFFSWVWGWFTKYVLIELLKLMLGSFANLMKGWEAPR